MNVKVAYYTKSGNTQKIADAIAAEIGCDAVTVDQTIKEQVDVLFLGASVYKFGIDKKVIEFINNLDATQIGEVAIFSTSAMSDSGYPKLVDLLTKKGITVSKEHFYCRGQFMFANKNLPNADDIISAKNFARNIVK
ncbi:MAG: flavodoxin domain-containing protein [Lachnospiraceae bacterium]